MGTKSNYLENKWLNYQYGNVAYTPPATLYLALLTTGAGEAGGGVEVTGNAYARVAITNNTTNFPTVSDSVKTNGVAFTFPAATPGSWGTIVGWALYDAPSGGNLQNYGDITPNRVSVVNDAITFPIGALTITED